jgi:hypothetical protein
MPKLTPIEIEKLRAFMTKTLTSQPRESSLPRLKDPKPLKEIVEEVRRKIFRKPSS